MRHRRPWKSVIFRHVLAIMEGLLWILGGGLLLSLVLWKMGSPSAVIMRILSQLVWCTGAFLSGRRAGLHGRRYGIRTGLICGIGLSLALLCGMMILHEEWHTELLLRMGLMLIFGVIGGIIGVNTKLRKPPD